MGIGRRHENRSFFELFSQPSATSQMSAPLTEHVTELLEAATNGDSSAAEQLLPLVYEQFRALAEYQMAKEPAGQTLQPTALVQEAYLRLKTLTVCLRSGCGVVNLAKSRATGGDSCCRP